MTASARHTASYYAASSLPQPDYPALAGERVADVCVIGGGFSGLNTALELAERGFSVVLLEARKIAWGASGRNGGQLIRGVGHGLEQFANVIGTDGVRQMKLMGLEAVEIVRERVERFQIACDLTWGYCDLANKPRDLLGLAEDAEALRSLGYRHEVRLLQAGEMGSVIGSDRYVGGMIDMGSGHLHPLNLALGEAAAAEQLRRATVRALRSDAHRLRPRGQRTHRPRQCARQDPGAGLQRLPEWPEPPTERQSAARRQLHHRHRAVKRSPGRPVAAAKHGGV